MKDYESKVVEAEVETLQLKKCKSSIKSWRRKFVADFTKKEFIPIKGLFFLIYGANVALIPFLTLQARSLGITEEEVGLIYSFIPIAALIAPTLSGMLADRIGNFRVLLSIVTALSGLCGLLFLLVPVGRITYKLPDDLPYELTCFQEGSALRIIEPHQCDVIDTVESFHINILQCSLICVNEMNENLTSFAETNSNLICENSSNCLHKKNSVYLYESNNSTDIDNTVFAIVSKNLSIFLNSSQQNENPEEYTYRSSQTICPVFEKQESRESTSECYVSCTATTPRENHCSNTVTIKDISSQLTFYSHLLIRVLKEFTLATSMPLLEGAAVTILREHKGDFGFQRMYCNVGMMIMTPISGTLIDYFSLLNGLEDFRPAMYMYCSLKLVAAFIILFLSLEFKQGSKKVISEFSLLMLNADIIAFLAVTFLAGMFFGYIETFLFWLLEDLGADKQLMGLTVTVGSVFGIPVLMMSTFILKKFGYVHTICTGFAIYIIRLIGYTVISNPWWAMPFEALECITVSLMVVTFVSYASSLASPGTVVTLQGMQGGLYNGVGRGAGSLVGGYLIETIGIFKTFRVMAAMSGVVGILYFSVNLLIQSNRKKVAKRAKQNNSHSEEIDQKPKIVDCNCLTTGNSVYVISDGIELKHPIKSHQIHNNNVFVCEFEK